MNDNNILLIKQLAELLEQAQTHVNPGSVLYADITRILQTAKRRYPSAEELKKIKEEGMLFKWRANDEQTTNLA